MAGTLEQSTAVHATGRFHGLDDGTRSTQGHEGAHASAPSRESTMKRAVSKDGTSIAFDQTGAGHPVILVGGALSFRKFPAFQKLTDLLSPHFTVINYDRRGRGDSGDTAPYAVAREVEDIEALIKAVGGSASVWGWSSGAALALTAAASG